jgi:hypothetical protein
MTGNTSNSMGELLFTCTRREAHYQVAHLPQPVTECPVCGFCREYVRHLPRQKLDAPLEPGKVYHVVMLHDDWCAIHAGGECNCDPDVIRHAEPDRVCETRATVKRTRVCVTLLLATACVLEGVFI